MIKSGADQIKLPNKPDYSLQNCQFGQQSRFGNRIQIVYLCNAAVMQRRSAKVMRFKLAKLRMAYQRHTAALLCLESGGSSAFKRSQAARFQLGVRIRPVRLERNLWKLSFELPLQGHKDIGSVMKFAIRGNCFIVCQPVISVRKK